MADTPRRMLVSVDYLANQIRNAVIHPLATDPVSPKNFQIWANTTANKLKIKLPAGAAELATMDDVNAGGVSAATFNANTILKADVDDTPVALDVPTSTFVGRAAAGSIAALTVPQAQTLLGLPSGTVANQAYVDAAIANLIDTAPGTLDTLNELAAALGDDPNFATSVNTALGNRLQTFSALIGDTVATSFAITHGFTREVTAACYIEATGERVFPGESMGAPASTQYTLEFAAAPATNEYRVVIHGKP